MWYWWWYIWYNVRLYGWRVVWWESVAQVTLVREHFTSQNVTSVTLAVSPLKVTLKLHQHISEISESCQKPPKSSQTPTELQSASSKTLRWHSEAHWSIQKHGEALGSSQKQSKAVRSSQKYVKSWKNMKNHENHLPDALRYWEMAPSGLTGRVKNQKISSNPSQNHLKWLF